ncbi:MAG TPA: prohibitin family protein [Candidatus Babeliales bacterium]|nr:prohibitin family protein [Candidatus Babeliales bacterium]
MNQYQKPQFDSKKFRPLIILGIAVVLLAIFWGSVTVKIQPGHAGIIFRQFGVGLDKGTVYYEGFEFILPWNEMIIYEVRQQQVMESMQALTSDQLTVGMDMTILYSPIADKIGFIHDKNGTTYEAKIIIPAVRAALRDVIARYIPEEINSTKRDIVVEEIRKKIEPVFAKNYLVLEDVLIRNIQLPAMLTEAINRKLKQEQEALEYEYKLKKEIKEAERKKIEAEGIETFQRIVSKSINENLLRWKGIEATLELSKSTNAKTVVVGGGKDGLPLILGQ